METKKWGIFLLSIIFISLASAQNIYDDCSIYGTCPPSQQNITIININQSVNVTQVNSTDFWDTDQGSLKNINSTQFEETGGLLTAIISYWDTLYCKLTGCTMEGNITAPFIFAKINASNVTNAPWLETAQDVKDLGFNTTDELDDRYLTSFLDLYFYNNSDPFNSTYTTMNTTVPTGTIHVDTYTSMSDGQNLLTPRILSTINLTLLQAGAYDQHTVINFVSGTKDVQLNSELYKKLANNTEVLIGISPNSGVLVSGIEQQVEWTGTISNDTMFAPGDHLVMRLYAFVSGLGSAPTIQLKVADDTAARLDIGVSPSDIHITEIDPFWSDNFTLYNSSWSSINNESYYLKTNPFNFFNSTNPQTELDPKAYNTSLILTIDEPTLDVNRSDFWDDVDTFNTTQMEDSAGELHIKDSWISLLFDLFFGTKDTDDLTEGSTNLYDNQSWNHTAYFNNASGTFSIGSHTIDTNETVRFNTSVGSGCSVGAFVTSIDVDGTLACAFESPPALQNLWEIFDDDQTSSIGASSPADIFVFHEGNELTSVISGAGINYSLTGLREGTWNVTGNVIANSSLGVGTDPAVRFHVQENDVVTLQARIENTLANGRALFEVKGDSAFFDMRAYGTNHDETLFGMNMSDTAAMIGRLGEFIIGTFENEDIIIGTNNIERMRITKDGKFGFLTSSPDELFSLGRLSETDARTYANADEAYLNFYQAQNFPSSNQFDRVLDIVSSPSNTGSWIRFLTGGSSASPTPALILSPDNDVNVTGLIASYTSGSAHVCVFNNGSLFASEGACP